MPEKDITIRLYSTLFRLYVDENNKFYKSLLDCWNNEIKPYILQKYPIALKGYFNANSDLHFIVTLIEELKEKFKSQIEEEKKNINKEIIKGEEDNNNNIQKNIIKEKKLPEEEISSIVKNELKNKSLESQNIEEEDITILRRKNMPKISKFLEEFIQQNNLKIKRSNSMMNLRPHSQTIASSSTCDDSIYNEDNIININQLIIREHIEKNYYKKKKVKKILFLMI